MKKLPIGISDFEELISGDYYYIDKTLLVKELLSFGAKATLIPRPRRFGKTLNVSMLKYFFEKVDISKARLFDGLKICEHADAMAHQGQYPVIFLSLKSAKSLTWDQCYNQVVRCLSEEFKRHEYLMNSQSLSTLEKEEFRVIISGKASLSDYKGSLKSLCQHLAAYHGKNPIVLIDEYDSPIHSAFLNKYYDQMIDFMRSLLGDALKDNSSLSFAVITGILRVAKESIFSGLNNLHVCTMLSNRYADKFGLLENEVAYFLEDFNLSDSAEEVRAWYNGYAVGGSVKVYNPWSILSFVSERGNPRAYWINTSDNQIIRKLLLNSSAEIKKDIELLLVRESIKQRINEDVVFPSLYSRDDIVWSFLLFCGYLTFEEIYNEDDILYGSLRLPNSEVASFYKGVVLSLLEENLGVHEYQSMLKSLVSGDVEEFKTIFYDMVAASLSTFDTGGKKPERFYHALVVGMLVSLREHYEVTSNRESGYGRYDVMIIPRKPTPENYGIIIEFKKKTSSDPTLEHAALSGLKQIEKRAYQTRLTDAGVQNVIKLAIAFDGKEALVLQG